MFVPRFLLAASLALLPHTSSATPPPADAVYPAGRIFPFMGYSGIPERDALHHFSVAGPDYSQDTEARLAAAERAGLSHPYKIGIDMDFHAKAPSQPRQLDPSEIKRLITAQVAAVADRPSICWWYLVPEEIRHWRKNEMEYLQAATEAIRAADPLQRPIWMYEPNHRDASSLLPTSRHLDIIGKGFYANLAGFRDQRIWIRWSMEQQIQAIQPLEREDGRKRTPLVMPELCADPEDPALDHLIPRWTRHDVYLGLMAGGKGVAIWSLFPRNEVKRTWQIWYDSYARLASELTGPLNLGQVFLFGKDNPTLEIKTLEGPREIILQKGPKNQLEAGTTSDSEKQSAQLRYPSPSIRQLEWNGATYIFLCNSSATETVKFQSSPLPDHSSTREIFTWRDLPPNTRRLYGWLAPLEVKCFRIQAAENPPSSP